MNQYQKLDYINVNYPIFGYVARDERLKNAVALKVLIRTYNGGRYGRFGYNLELVKPCRFKNGKLKSHDYETIRTVGDDDVLQLDNELPFEFDGIAGYNAGGAKTDDAIYRVLGYIDETGYHSLKK